MSTAESLSEFIRSNPDSREMKRAISTQMRLQDYSYEEIQTLLGVSAGFIREWQVAYAQAGIAGLRLKYKGSQPYLNEVERQAVIDWLKTRDYWHLSEVQAYIEATYDVVFSSLQSYYELLKAAGLSWKKTQATQPKADATQIAEKTGHPNLAGSALVSDPKRSAKGVLSR
jgi:putative transposase